MRDDVGDEVIDIGVSASQSDYATTAVGISTSQFDSVTSAKQEGNDDSCPSLVDSDSCVSKPDLGSLDDFDDEQSAEWDVDPATASTANP